MHGSEELDNCDRRTRRRRHAAARVVGAVVLLLLTGTAVTADSGPTGPGGWPAATGPVPASGDSEPVLAATELPGPVPLDPSQLLDPAQVARVAPGRDWQVGQTGTPGDGPRLPCQRERSASPQASAALVRTYQPSGGGPSPAPAAVVQRVQQARTETAAREAFDTARDWYGGCRVLGTHLVDTRVIEGVGDEAVAVRLRTGRDPRVTLVVALARTGRLVTTLARSTRPPQRPPSDRVTRTLLAAGVNTLCGVEGAGRCAGPPRGHTVAPVPVGPAPAMLAALDLPAIPGVQRPWVSTDPQQATQNSAATRCDRADFSGLRGNTTRTFLAPGAGLPDSFGLTETVGTFARAGPARAFVSRLQRRMRTCEDDDLAVEVANVLRERGKQQDLLIWSIKQKISDQRTVTYRMAVFRRGAAVGQATFVRAPRATIGKDGFDRLARRAASRLGQLSS